MKELIKAKKRLEEGRMLRATRRKSGMQDEPELLLSGSIDEVEFRRIVKKDEKMKKTNGNITGASKTLEETKLSNKK